MSDELTLHAYDWKIKDEYDDDGNLVIHGWCLDQKSVPHLVRFHDFPAYCHVELPLYVGHKRMYWSGYKAEQVFQYICWRLGENKPFRYMIGLKEKLYYYRQSKKYPMMTIMFKNMKSMYKLKNILSKPIKVRNLGVIACKVWETKISPIRKLLTLRNVNYCQWFKIKGIKVTGEDKVSKLEQEYVVDRSTMFPIPPEETSSWATNPKIMSFDIETYSDRHKALPDSLSSKHVCYMVSCVTQRLNDEKSKTTDIILVGDCDDTDMANVIKVDNEIELINKMTELVNKYDPEILTGYNIFGYDIPYMDTRLKRRLKEWKPMGRLLNEPTSVSSFSWGSSAYGHNEINLLEMDGRISVDLYPIIKRDYKLPLYNLGYVSNYFLGRTKHPVTAVEMFETFELYLDSKKTPDMDLKDYMNSKLVWIMENPDIDTKEDVYKRLHLNQYMKHIDEVPIMNDDEIPNITLKQHAMFEMKKVVEYCVVDSDLVLDIFEKINGWIALIEMSNVVAVTPVEIFTRGQQLRVLNQVYNETSPQGIILDEVQMPFMNYEGGFVFEPIPGIYHNIPCLDFKSLYPTVMISNNIDHRTMVPPELMDKIPDDKCHVIEWDGEDENEEMVHYRYKFVKKDVMEGILPKLLTKLISERDAVRKVQKTVDKTSVEWIVLERRQLALKVSANSMYGALGAQKGGKLPLPEAAACVTAKSRESTKLMNKYLESKGHRVVYGDTDSSMPDIGIKDPKNAYKKAKDVAIELSKLFPKPMLVEDETVYHTMLCIKKKMYLCIEMNRDGTPNLDKSKLKVKGVVPARRDNCKYQRDCYIDTAWKVLLRTPMMETYNYIIDICLKLMQRQVPWKDLVVIKGLGHHYKSKSYFMKIFSDELLKIGKPATPGDRLEYVIVNSHGVNTDQLLGYKMRLPSTYLERLESKTPEYIDYVYYMEKALANCIQSQLFQVGYKEELEELERQYLISDRMKVIEDLRKTNCKMVVNHLMEKSNGNTEAVIDYLMNSKLKPKVSPLVSKHIKKRRRIVTRVHGKPIDMMVKIIKQKKKCTELIKQYTPYWERKQKKLTINIIGNGNDNNNDNNKQ